MATVIYGLWWTAPVLALICGLLLLVKEKLLAARIAGVGAMVPAVVFGLTLLLGWSGQVYIYAIPTGLVICALGGQFIINKPHTQKTGYVYAQLMIAIIALSIAGWTSYLIAGAG